MAERRPKPNLGPDGSPAGFISPLEVDPTSEDDGQPSVGMVPYGGAPDPVGFMPAGEGEHEQVSTREDGKDDGY